MCVIIVKPTKGQTPTKETIIAALTTNPHGSAIAWKKNGKIEVFRTLNNDDMIEYYTEHFNEFKNTCFVFHARIATHGSKSLKNTHGWRTKNGHFFHNGILNIESRGDLTDSETFLRDIYEPIAYAYGHKTAEPAIRAIIGSSKFAFIFDDGSIKIYGNYQKRNGCFFSNLNHERHTERITRHQSYIDFWENQTIFARPKYK